MRPQRVGVDPFPTDEKEVLFKGYSGEDVLDEVGAV